MTDFKWRHFQGDVILWAVRWYCRYPISYRDLEEMLAERGISVDPTIIAGSSATPGDGEAAALVLAAWL
ncbi:Putative transposase (identified by ISEscan HMM) [Klebsiella pneumoniae]|nr:Putative transposase (identified by ISEscan HMM) [Klebsiella pneumoniae]